MCQQHQAAAAQTKQNAEHSDNGSQKQPFPWHLGAYDAHCHPTDTMSSTTSIPHMLTRTLTLMATRSQDQHLVAQVAAQTGAPERGIISSINEGCTVIPSFGWHPWFSHQLYDDAELHATFDPMGKEGGSVDAAKKAHYEAVLSSAPDDDFVRSLPTPTALSSFLSQTRERLENHQYALVGEVGLDKAFRLPQAFTEFHAHDAGTTPGGREGRLLSPHRVKMQHQQAILKAQLQLAGEMGRAASVHGVQAHGVLFDTVKDTWKGYEKKVKSRREKRLVAPGVDESSDEDDEDPKGKPFPPRICLHSFSGSVEVMGQWLDPKIPAAMFFSFSRAVNLSTEAGEARFVEVMVEIPEDKILVESDMHYAGEDMDAAVEDMYRLICRIRVWSLKEGLEKIGRNYAAFVFGRAQDL